MTIVYCYDIILVLKETKEQYQGLPQKIDKKLLDLHNSQTSPRKPWHVHYIGEGLVNGTQNHLEGVE